MTREETIDVLKWKLKTMEDMLEQHPDFTDADDYVGALKYAIDALSAELCEDCISRAEAIKALEYDLSIEADGGLDKYRTVIKDLLNAIYNTQKKAIEDLPSIQPKPKTDVLDKIRAEIEAEPYVSKMEVLDIIDKYRESEDKE